MTIVDLNNLGYRDEPFVLAQDVAQVFYIKDMSSKPKKGINKQKDEPKRHIILSAIPPFELNADPCDDERRLVGRGGREGERRRKRF